jgi:hypothetical protein
MLYGTHVSVMVVVMAFTKSENCNQLVVPCFIWAVELALTRLSSAHVGEALDKESTMLEKNSAEHQTIQECMKPTDERQQARQERCWHCMHSFECTLLRFQP